MSEDTTEAPEGAAEGAPAPNDLSVFAVAQQIEGLPDEEGDDTPTEPERDDKGRFKATKAEDQPEGEEPEPEEPEQAEATGEDEGDEPESEDTEAEEAPQGFDWDKVPGDAKFRLRDGTEVTAADLKKDWDHLRQARQTHEELQRERQQFHQWAAESTQHHQHLEQILPAAISALTAQLPEIPEPPPPDLSQSDPFEAQARWDAHLRAKSDFEAKAAQIQQLQAAQQMQHAQQSRERDAQMQRYLHDQREKLVEAMPEMKDPAKRREFAEGFMDLGREYGFSDDELNRVYDPRVMKMARDLAEARRKLSRPKPKPEPNRPERKAPVAQPGRRQSKGENQQRQMKSDMERVRQSGGDVRQVARLIENLD